MSSSTRPFALCALDLCLLRNWVLWLADLRPAAMSDVFKKMPFESYEPCYIHFDYKYLQQMRAESRPRYFLVKIDRATRRGRYRN